MGVPPACHVLELELCTMTCHPIIFHPKKTQLYRAFLRIHADLIVTKYGG